MKKPFGPILVALGLGLVLAACAAKPESKEDMLSDSGFKVVPLKTPAQLASFKGLPRHQLTRKNYNGKSVWMYADPTSCGCLYMGTQAAYDSYIKKAQAKMIATAMKANFSDDPYNPSAMDAAVDNDWDWGPWGNPGYYGLPY